MMITDYLQVADTRYARVLVPEPLPWDIWRIRNDFESPAWDYACRTLHITWMNPEMKQAPQVVPFYLTPNATSGGNRTPVETWKPYLWAINGIVSDDDRKWRYYTATNSGYFNRSGWAQLESLGMGDCLVRVLGWERGFARIETLYLEDGYPDPGTINYELTPWLVHRFTVITPANNVIDPPPGRIYSPLVVKRGLQLWIKSELLIEV